MHPSIHPLMEHLAQGSYNIFDLVHCKRKADAEQRCCGRDKEDQKDRRTWVKTPLTICALCRVIMYKRHMVFLLSTVRVKNFMSAVPQASSQGSRCTSASASSRLDLLCLRYLNSPCQFCLGIAAMFPKPPQLHHCQLTRKFDKS